MHPVDLVPTTQRRRGSSPTASWPNAGFSHANGFPNSVGVMSMRRRRWLALLSGCGVGSTAGCVSSHHRGCPTPKLEDELQYERRSSTAVLDPGDAGVRLLERASDLDRLDTEHIEPELARWARNTPFETQVVLAIQVGSSGQSTPLEVRGVARDDETVHAYTCIEERGATDDWAPFAALLRVPYEDRPPADARLTHWEAGDEHVYE